MPDLLNLQTLIAAATAGSFAGAAKRLGISPAMVGRRIQALEQEYGVKLIERTTRTQRLTEVGSRFLVKANRIIDELEELNEISRPDAEAMSGRLRLSAPTTLGIERLAPVMAELAERHPALSVELNLSDRNVDLVAEGYDLAIRIGELKPSSLIARRVGSYHFVCCASPTYLGRFAVPERPEDLRLGRCILNLNLVPRDEWPFVTKGGESFTVGVRGNIEIDNGEALRTAALAGAGIIYVPVDLVAEDITDGRLVEVLAGWRKLVLPIHAIHPSRRFVPGRIGAIIDAIARGLRD